MPSTYLSDIQSDDPYNISMFFWYFEARNDPDNAPTTIYLAGGPGESSVFGVMSDGGPCYVANDSKTTYNNEWSMNTHSNMLCAYSTNLQARSLATHAYKPPDLDQPVSTGFSYNTLVRSTFNAIDVDAEGTSDTGILSFDAYNGSVPEANSTFLYGIFPSQNVNHTANSTAIVARTLWHFSQAWFGSFPEWTKERKVNKKVAIWGNSHAGYWVPNTAAYIQSQNLKIRGGENIGTSTVIDLEMVGWSNGCTDLLYQAESFPETAYNNVYGVELYNSTVYAGALDAWSRPGGCRDQLLQCRGEGEIYDPEFNMINASVNAICNAAFICAFSDVAGPFDALTVRDDFDFGHNKPDPFPYNYLVGYMNSAEVQQELGVPLNFTAYSTLVENAIFFTGGDAVRTPGLKRMEYLLDQGIRLALVYGDRDYRCPMLGGETLSLKAEWKGAAAFRKAGYERIKINSTSEGGLVRQHGNLSFSSVWESGHDVGAFQPEANFRIFNRALFNKDVATGNSTVNDEYSTSGAASVYSVKNFLPANSTLTPVCVLWNVAPSCTEEQFEALMNGTAIMEDYIVISPDGSDGVPLGAAGGF
ncbi:hypothetical protein LTR97_007193 [Elasticomyces elasticus]|uniref:Uncharacterized protein n=1 Tax=Elasticomyces elasticus TaxID=574655 RepID=A0AAN7W1Z3_9PEZI|nr:hypothetical protein LTR97_007193 [Elasticomyces elasticus]